VRTLAAQVRPDAGRCIHPVESVIRLIATGITPSSVGANGIALVQNHYDSNEEACIPGEEALLPG
jgi:hypothetical protein